MSAQSELDEAFVEVGTILKSIRETLAASAIIIDVVTGNEPRGDFSGRRIWIGGVEEPANFLDGDIWLSESPQNGSSPVAPTITTTSFTSLVTDTSFTQALSSSGDTPITWSVSSGTLPAGITLNSSTGVVSGTPSASGAYNVTIQATNAAGSDTQVYSGTVTTAVVVPTITTTTLSSMTQNTVYNQTLSMTGSTPATWGISSGSLPAGLGINSSTGTISGTPTVSGAYSFTVQATNSAGSDTQLFTGTISAAAASLSMFGASAPGTSVVVGNDGNGSLYTATSFYSTAARPAYNVTGLRIWRPAGETAFAALGGTARAVPLPWPGASGLLPIPSVAGAVQTKTFPAGSAGQWQDVLFDTPIAMHNATSGTDGNDVIWLMVQFTGGNHYMVVNGMATGPIVNSGMAISAGEEGRGWNTIASSNANGTYYGIDILYQIP